MEAKCGENFLEITLSKGVVFHTTPSLLFSLIDHRILPFIMIKEKRGNWEEVKEWFEQRLGWKLDFKDSTPMDIPKELDLIENFTRLKFNPKVKWRAKERRLSE